MYTEDYELKIKKYLRSRPKGPTSYAKYLCGKYKGFKNICVFGAGNLGLSLPEELGKYGIKVNFFCDNNPEKTGKVIKGIPCISLEQLMKFKNETVILIASRYYKDIYNQLKSLFFPYIDRVLENKFLIDEYLDIEDSDIVTGKLCQVLRGLADEQSCYILTRIVEEWCRNEYQYGQLDDINSTPQYFDKHIVNKKKGDIFVDCGAYDGDTFCDYIKWIGNHFQEAYLFELSTTNFNKLCKNIKENYPCLTDQISIINKGVSDTCRSIIYKEDDEGSAIIESGGTKGSVITLDSYFKKKEVSFIKMDIEGAELAALKGAQELITRCRPQLAVCLYHQPIDLWQIPLFLMEHFPEYRILIRHHTDLLNETVCYALPK